ncbi:MAG: ATP-binding protein [Candidatus Paceibacterota bacterium]|jgi:predicted ATPase|nr:ATP-binding protein [Candidatus Paceibacterota bacterium]
MFALADILKRSMRTYVITGPSSCGKSTLIEHLRERGFLIVPEVARSVLSEGVFHPCRDPYLFQQEIAKRQAAAEDTLRQAAGEIAFLDRGFLDQIAYCRYTCGSRIPPEVQTDAHYDGVFFLEMLPNFVADGVRVEKGTDEALDIYRMTVEAYQKRGVPSVNIPVRPVPERADMVLKHLDLL